MQKSWANKVSVVPPNMCIQKAILLKMWETKKNYVNKRANWGETVKDANLGRTFKKGYLAQNIIITRLEIFTGQISSAGTYHSGFLKKHSLFLGGVNFFQNYVSITMYLVRKV